MGRERERGRERDGGRERDRERTRILGSIRKSVKGYWKKYTEIV